jgi:hypothetical protein
MMATVSGPVTGGRHGWPFGATLADLGSVGYVEEEYFVSGEAPRYRPAGRFGSDGRWPAERTAGATFSTRVVVRRPGPGRFNGTLVVEWNNVSAGSDIFEGGDTPAVFEEGFAYAGVTCQHVGVHGFPQDPKGLRNWDPDRYGDLRIDDDTLSYGIFTEVTRALLSPSASAPLRDLAPDRVVAIGGSQSAGRLVTYINAVHPLEGVFDAFVPFTWFGSGSSLDDPTLFNPHNADALARLTTHPTAIRADLGVPVLVVNSECETLSCFPVRQPDTDSFRFWEVAGAPHGPRLHMERILPKMERDGLAPPGGVAIDLASLHPIPWARVLDAGILAVHRWLSAGDAPPVQPRIQVQGEPPAIERDRDGNAIGGVRVPELTTTLWRCIGSREESGPAGPMGVWSPLPDAVVLDRFGDRDGYLAAFAEAVDDAVAAGVLRAADGKEALAAAAENRFPPGG